jgi:hypothetical protein
MGGMGRTINGSMRNIPVCRPRMWCLSNPSCRGKSSPPFRNRTPLRGGVCGFFGSIMFGTPGFPLSAVPLQEIVDRAASGLYKAKPAKVFPFDEICAAHQCMEANQANGKLVVRV